MPYWQPRERPLEQEGQLLVLVLERAQAPGRVWRSLERQQRRLGQQALVQVKV